MGVWEVIDKLAWPKNPIKILFILKYVHLLLAYSALHMHNVYVMAHVSHAVFRLIHVFVSMSGSWLWPLLFTG